MILWEELMNHLTCIWSVVCSPIKCGGLRVKKFRTSVHALQESGCEDRYIKESTYDHALLGRDMGSFIVNRHQPW
jgi:hypothetical protein